jgi:hypothetical protein
MCCQTAWTGPCVPVVLLSVVISARNAAESVCITEMQERLESQEEKSVENVKNKVRPIVFQFLVLHEPCLFRTWESHLRDRNITGESEMGSFIT